MGKKTDLESVHLVNHSKCMLAAFQNFRQDETMLDVTLVCNGVSLKAHKLVLSGCSPLFKEMFADNPCSHPIVILRDYDYCDLRAVIDFVYKGELSVPRERLMSALKVAEELQVRGLKRSEPNREKYEKLYNKVCSKLSGRKKRKRYRHNSSDSENELLNISDSDEIVESDGSSNAKQKMSASETQPMDVEPTDMDHNSTTDKDIRPVVLRVGDHVSSNEESNSKHVFEDEESNVISSVEHNLSETDSQKEVVISGNEALSGKEEMESQICKPVSESIVESSHVDSFADCSDNANSQLELVNETAEGNFQEEITEVSEECSDQVSSISISLSPKPQVSQSDEAKLPDEGKRFICSKCDSVFTSRISFMKHKAIGHSSNTGKKNPQTPAMSYKCSQCSFTSEDFEYFKNHLLTHLNKVPFKCNTCSEEFTSEELYKQHASIHNSESVSLHDISSSSVEDLFSTQTRIPEKIVEFRCSVCFGKFTSKLRCQLHEKTCDGGS